MEPITLNENELEVLRILWERGELKPAEIEEQFSWTIENATLRSVLVNLIEKKHVVRQLEGKAFRYATRLPKSTALHKLMHSLARVFSGGSTHELVAQLVQTDALTPADLKLLHETATGVAAKKRKAKRPRK
jgi:BlaI family transcriptional regulator, penicillinase repressor